jgi:excisionase family DNA binding protein
VKGLVQKEYPEILTLTQAAEYVQVSTKTIQRMIERGDLKASKVSNAWRIRKQDIEEYLDSTSNKKPK